ncbi:MAG: hypothetical protein EBR82_39225 [Caulobacteraceae bacterium]|nr:hypothetical protein [Caulobacteraceae bacterium]
MAGAVDLTASMGGGGGSLDPLIAALDRYSSMLERVASAMGAAVPESRSPSMPSGLATTLPSSVKPDIKPLDDANKKLAGGFLKTNIVTRILGEAFKRLNDLLKPLNEVVVALGDVFQPVIDVLASMMRIILGPVLLGYKALSTLLGAVLRPIQMFLNGLNIIIDTISDVISGLDVLGKAQRAAANAVGDAFKGIRKTVLNLLTDPLNAVPALIGQIREAVETLNPGAMVEFDLALRDLKAVFGEALLPIVRIATDVIRKFADTLRPILQKLQPQFEKLAKSIGDHLIRNIDMMASAIEKLIPVLDQYLFYQTQSINAERDRQRKALQAADPLTAAFKNIAEKITPRAATFDFGRLQNRTLEARIGDEMRALQKDLDKAKKAGNEKEAETAQKKLDALENVYKTITQQGTRFEFLQKVDPQKAAADAAYQEALKATMDQAAGLQKDIAAKAKPEQIDKRQKDLADAMGKLDKEMNRLIGQAGGPGAAAGLAAATNPAFKSIADLTRETLLSAFVATSSQAQIKEKEDADARKNVAQLPEVIKNAAQEAFVAAMRQVQQIEPVAPGDAVFARGVA